MSVFSRFILWFGTAWVSLNVFSAEPTAAGPRTGDAPPELKLSRMVQGPSIEEVHWDKLKGKVVVLEFWNTGCVPCIQAIPHLNALVEEFRNRPVVFLNVSDDNPDHLKNFLERRAVKGWLALDGPFKATATAFGVTAIPHTVIVDSDGRIAAITHPKLLGAQHLEEIIAGKPSTLPQHFVSDAETAVVAVATQLPTQAEISLSGPFPQPNGPFGFVGWQEDGCVFKAQKASLTDVFAEFFHVSPKLISDPNRLVPEGLYDISAAAPPDQRVEFQRQFIESVRKKWGVVIEVAPREVGLYSLRVGSTNAPGLKSVQKRAGGGQLPGGFFLGGVPMSSIASYLERSLDKLVLDESGLQGLWAADVRWEMSKSELSSGKASDPAKIIRATREQLGLELQPTLRTMPTLEIRKSK